MTDSFDDDDDAADNTAENDGDDGGGEFGGVDIDDDFGRGEGDEEFGGGDDLAGGEADDDEDFGDFDFGDFDRSAEDDNDDDGSSLSPALIGLIAASLVLIVVIASLVGWLMFSFDEEEYEQAHDVPTVITALGAPPKSAAEPNSPAAKPKPEPTAKPEPAAEPEPTAKSTAKPEPEADAKAAAGKPGAPKMPVPAGKTDGAKTAAAAAPADAAAGATPESKKPDTAKPVVKKTFKEEKVVVAAIDPEMLDQTTSGPLPKIAPDGREPWQVYARPFTAPKGKSAKVSIIMAGLGLSKTQTLAAIQQLPGAVTLSFAPYARNLEDWIVQARAAGHEVLLELPMEPEDYPQNDPGPHTLLTTLSTPDNMERLNWLLGRFPGYVGVTNFMGAKFTANEQKMLPIIQSLKERGLLYLDAKTNRKSVAARIAKELKVPLATNNRFIDREASRVSIDARLYELERIAKSVGAAVGLAFPYPVTVERLAAWVATLEKKGITLAPLTALANAQPIR